MTRRNKFGVSTVARRTAFGIVFASRLEMLRYMVLTSMQQEGIIDKIKLQPKFLLQEAFKDKTGKKHRKIEYVADFKYQDLTTKEYYIEDTKGRPTPVFRLKEKLLRYKYPDLNFIVVTAKDIGTHYGSNLAKPTVEWPSE